jgi:hypothetical protein
VLTCAFESCCGGAVCTSNQAASRKAPGQQTRARHTLILIQQLSTPQQHVHSRSPSSPPSGCQAAPTELPASKHKQGLSIQQLSAAAAPHLHLLVLKQAAPRHQVAAVVVTALLRTPEVGGAGVERVGDVAGLADVGVDLGHCGRAAVEAAGVRAGGWCKAGGRAS